MYDVYFVVCANKGAYLVLGVVYCALLYVSRMLEAKALFQMSTCELKAANSDRMVRHRRSWKDAVSICTMYGSSKLIISSQLEQDRQ